MCIRDSDGGGVRGRKVEIISLDDGYSPPKALEQTRKLVESCLLYTSDAADERSSVDLGGRRIIKKKKKTTTAEQSR